MALILVQSKICLHSIPRTTWKWLLSISFATLFLLSSDSKVWAVATLQLYLEGGVYDAATETWIASDTDTLRLWAVGNVSGPGPKGDICDVRLAISYKARHEPVSIDLVESRTDDFGGFYDTSLANTATVLRKVTDGSLPLLDDGSSLPSHGEYGTGKVRQEFGLGNFLNGESPLVNFDETFTGFTTQTDTDAAIHVNEVSVDTAVDIELHFDIYCQVGGKIRPLIYQHHFRMTRAA